MGRLRHLGRALDACSGALARRPALTRAILGVLLVFAWTTAAGAVWFTWDLMASTPKRDMLRRVGDMAQATTLLDLNGRPAFTIFKEQRIEIPLAKVSPILQKAILSIEDQRFYDHQGRRHHPRRRIGAREPEDGPPGAGSQHAHAAARATELPDPRQDLPPQVPGDHRRRRARVAVLEERDSRALPEQGVFRRRTPRNRSGRAGLFREACVRSDARRGGAAGGAGEVAIELRADGEPRSRDRTPGRRAAGNGGLRARSRRLRPRRQRPSALR